MNVYDKRNRDRQQQHEKHRKLRGKFFDTFKGVLMNVTDATGREIKKGHLVQIPANALPAPVINFEVAEIKEGSMLDTPGVPKMPPMLILTMHLAVPINPANQSVPYCYIVGERKRIPVKAEDVADTKLSTEEPPEGITLTDGEDGGKDPKIQ